VPKAVVKLCDDQACVTIRSDLGDQLSARVGPAVVDVSPSAQLAAVGSPIWFACLFKATYTLPAVAGIGTEAPAHFLGAAFGVPPLADLGHRNSEHPTPFESPAKWSAPPRRQRQIWLIGAFWPSESPGNCQPRTKTIPRAEKPPRRRFCPRRRWVTLVHSSVPPPVAPADSGSPIAVSSRARRGRGI
jgi:hypothetical protein